MPAVALVANPERYHGMYVQVIGFAVLEFEGNALYYSRELAEVHDSLSGIWLDLSGVQGSTSVYDRKWVIVAGRFNAENRGHLGMFSGALESISRFEVWRAQ